MAPLELISLGLNLVRKRMGCGWDWGISSRKWAGPLSGSGTLGELGACKWVRAALGLGEGMGQGVGTRHWQA